MFCNTKVFRVWFIREHAQIYDTCNTWKRMYLYHEITADKINSISGKRTASHSTACE